MFGKMKDHIKSSFQEKLLNWFFLEGRSLPWREQYNPYHVWISEIMGQQTQMERVVSYFTRWVARFPSIESLAEADEKAVLKAWEGLGYYSRARNIMRTAGVFLSEYSGKVPESYEELLKLPGVGPYTAAAIMSIGFNKPYPLIDANVERVFSRIDDIDLPVKQAKAREKIQRMAEDLLVCNKPRQWNQALMELGALVCTPKNPKCSACPVQAFCLAYDAGTQYQRPVPAPKKKKVDISMACVVLLKDDQVFIQQRMKEDLWGGLWEFPGGTIDDGETPEEAAIREVAEETEWEVAGLKPFHTVVHYYTKYRVTLHGFFCCLPEFSGPPVLHAAENCSWVTLETLPEYPYPAGHRQLVKLLQTVGIPDCW